MSKDAAKTRYPGYDVLRKRESPSWDAVTRKVLDERLSISSHPRFLEPTHWAVLAALCDCLVAQPAERPEVPVAAMLDAKLLNDEEDGWRDARLPPLREAWRRGLTAIDAESHAAHNEPFARLSAEQQEALITHMQKGELSGEAWQGMPSDLFFSNRVLHDLYAAYYSHPSAWSEIGFGGPANPRGYVRLYKDRRDPWEPIEATAANADVVAQENTRVR